MIQRKFKGSLAFCPPPGYARLASLADVLLRPAPLPSLFAGYTTYTENETKGLVNSSQSVGGDYDQLLIL